MTELKLFHVVKRKMYHPPHKLPLIFDLMKILVIAQTFSFYIQFDCEGYALSDTFLQN